MQRAISRASRPISAFTWISLIALTTLSVLGSARTGLAQSLLPPVPSRITQRIDETQRTTLPGTVHRLAKPANDLGAVDDGTSLQRVQIMLKRSDAQQQALTQLMLDLHNPASPAYHHWLTPAQFGAQFGPSAEDIATLTKWLGTHGLVVNKLNPGSQTLEFSGSAAQFREAFHAEIHKFNVNGQIRLSNASDPQIPTALAPVVTGFSSLNNFPLHHYARKLGAATLNPTTHQTKPSWTEGLNGVSLILAPNDFAVQYTLNPLYNANIKGAGQTIAIINESNIDISLVNQYRSLFGLPANPPTVIIDGTDPGVDGINNPDPGNGASIEAYLDVEVAGAVAPLANIDLVIAGDTALDSGLLLAAEHAVYSNLAPVLSLSFGQCEATDLASGNLFWYSLWEQAAAQGQTVMVSSGDAGSAVCDNPDTQEYALNGQAVNGLASSPYNISVGGTDFYYSSYNGTALAQDQQLAQYWNLNPSNTTPTVSLLQRAPEQPWNSSQYGFNLFNQAQYGYGSTISSGSGGPSTCATGSIIQNTCKGWPKPAWQSGTGVPADGVRDQPDVSLFAANGANYTYYPICASDGDCQPSTTEIQITGVGGTSAAAPAFAGMMALVNQQYGPQGQAANVLYSLAAQYPNSFNDVTVGTNSVPCNITNIVYGSSILAPTNCIAVNNPLTETDPNYGTATEGQIGNTSTKVAEYNAGTGYDLASGLGTINAYNMVTNWSSVKHTATAVTLNLSGTTFPHGTPVTISGTVSPYTSPGSSNPDSIALISSSSQPSQGKLGLFTITNGSYAGTINSLPGGTYNLYADFSGNTIDAPGTSPATQVTITPEASTVAFSIDNLTTSSVVTNGASVSYGAPLQLAAVPAPSNPVRPSGNSVPTGTVAFTDAGTIINTASLTVTGNAIYGDPATIGAHSITAAYSGDNSYNASTSAPIAFTVVKNTPEILYGGSGTSVEAGTTFTILIANSAQFSSGYFSPVAAPTGVVTVTGLPTGSITSPTLQPSVYYYAVDGATQFPIPTNLAAGTYSVTFSYAGDSNYNATSYTTSLTVTSTSGLAATTTTASATSTTTGATSAVTISTTVTGQSGKGLPTGTLILVANGVTINGYNLTTTGAGTTVSETFSVSTAALFPGPNNITVQYSGSSVYAPSFATLTVTAPGTSNFVLSNSGNIAENIGSAGTSTLRIQPSGGFTGAVALSCVVTSAVSSAPAPTCSIPSSASITGTSPVSATVTLTSAATTPPGTYNVLITGTSGNLVNTTQLQVVVSAVKAIALGANLSAITIPTLGGSGTDTITVTPAGGFTGSVALTCAVTPSTGTSVPTCSVGPTVSVTGTSAVSSTLNIGTTATTSYGNYTVTITATASGVTTQTTTVALQVGNPAIALTNGGNITTLQGGGGTSTITVTPSGGFTGAVTLTCSVLPSTGTSVPTCTVNTPVNITGSTPVTSTLTVTTSAATTPGAYALTVNSSASGAGFATTGLVLTVNAPPAITLTNSASIIIPTAGGNGSSTLTVTPTGGFTGAVALSCAVTPTSGTSVPACSVGPSVTISGLGAATSTLNITTTGTTTNGAYTITVTATASGVTAQVATVALTVGTPSIALTNSGAITIATPGGSGSSTITATPGGGFNGTVFLSCSVSPSNQVDTPTCGVNSTLVLSGTSAATATLTINTTAATGALHMPGSPFKPLGGGVALATLLGLLLPKRRRRWASLLCLLVLTAAATFATGCGSSSGSNSNPGTPTGTYLVTVTATSGSLSTQTTVTVNLQ